MQFQPLQSWRGPSLPQLASSVAVWVFSFSSRHRHRDAIGKVCRDHNIIFALNGSRAIGARGIDIRNSYVDALVHAASSGYTVLTLPVPPKRERSALVLIAPRDRSQTASIHRTLAQAGVDAAVRGDKIRFSPHFYNTEADIDEALSVLARF